MIYLYLKIHNKTGLKYLGQTTQDPYIYKGSGKRWLNHINKHGNDVTTHILLETTNKDDIKELGLYYSQIWDIVKNKQFANIVEERGTGGDNSNCIEFKNSIKNRDFTYKAEESYRKKVSQSVTKAWESKFSDPNFNRDEFKKMCSSRSRKMWETRGISEEEIKQRSARQREYVNTPGVKENLSQKSKENWLQKSNLYEVTYPSGKKETVKCLRGWCKDNDLPYYKLYNTMRYKRPSQEGWMVNILHE